MRCYSGRDIVNRYKQLYKGMTPSDFCLFTAKAGDILYNYFAAKYNPERARELKLMAFGLAVVMDRQLTRNEYALYNAYIGECTEQQFSNEMKYCAKAESAAEVLLELEHIDSLSVSINYIAYMFGICNIDGCLSAKEDEILASFAQRLFDRFCRGSYIDI